MSISTIISTPALPEEREKLNLPPKSYADAAEKTPELPNDKSDENKENEVNGQAVTSSNGSDETGHRHKVSVLRIVDVNGTTDSAKLTDNKEARPKVDRQESKREYSATGLDDTPKSPPRHRHRKSSSQKSNGTNENGRSSHKNTMPDTQDGNENTTVFEKIRGERNGTRLHRTQELPPTRKYIFGYHPHGIISHGAFAAFATEALGFSQLFPGIKNTLLTLDTNFRIPLYREYALAMGLASVSKESCENLLSKGGPNKEGMGRAITIVVGGAAESLDAQPYSLRLVLKRRKGFVKMAIRTGADLVPVLAFGENDLYDQFSADSHPRIHKFQLLVKKLMGFTIPLFHARGVFNYDVGLMPYRRPLNIVVGRPIKVVQSKSPEQKDIDRVHEEYVTELERLWGLWKDDFAPNRKTELQLIE
ncbi:hypothetical protein SS1G_04804 [Sclerotinia sclerotiorum 1980 UF-70]|uniref:Diacylglycerol O-acyltransferase n=1 Tax=Sclerotinia sclerotiorum (strain ATCC 18683 / 1980 / Ss-1) TaxID=665079 RepID=A7EHL2_SCLS1|nr:hypothetical protein SS1G_04804 [Sclerotinia sclerotiorum 1980 UF-70]EDO02328.1 hypothetical protein SS1G_04804 [Sclerotinia sclerotiorum 1980 UF-70]